MKIIMEINRLPKTPNSIGKASIWASHKERHDWREEIAKHKGASLVAWAPLKKARLTLTRFSSKEPDVDNLYSSWKYVIDALVFNRLIEDDKPSNIDLRCNWEVIAPTKGKIKIEIQKYYDTPSIAALIKTEGLDT